MYLVRQAINFQTYREKPAKESSRSIWYMVFAIFDGIMGIGRRKLNLYFVNVSMAFILGGLGLREAQGRVDCYVILVPQSCFHR